MGWLIAFLVIIFIIGVIINYIEYILPVVLVLLLGFCIMAIFSAIAASKKKKKDAYNAKLSGEINEIASIYKPKNLSLGAKGAEYGHKSNVKADVCELVNEHKSALLQIADSCEETDKKISKILECEQCNSLEEKLEYLNNNKYELTRLKIESDKVHKKAENRKIQILHSDVQKLSKIKNAFDLLKKSEKCTASKVSAKKILYGKKIADLALFQYEQAPAAIDLEDFIFCLFANTILVFDKNGFFSTALETSALKIDVKRDKTKYRSDSNVGADSAPIVFDENRTRWLHACKDGSPDLRYKSNSRIEYTVPVNGYEYGTISVKIGEHSAAFTVSSSAALGAFEEIANIYSDVNEQELKAADILSIIELPANSEDELASLPLIIETKNIKS